MIKRIHLNEFTSFLTKKKDFLRLFEFLIKAASAVLIFLLSFCYALMIFYSGYDYNPKTTILAYELLPKLSLKNFVKRNWQRFFFITV